MTSLEFHQKGIAICEMIDGMIKRVLVSEDNVKNAGSSYFPEIKQMFEKQLDCRKRSLRRLEKYYAKFMVEYYNELMK